MGGNASPSGQTPGMIAEFNIINQVTSCSEIGIILADGLRNAIVRNNEITGLCAYGIVTALTVDGTSIQNSLIENNIVLVQGVYGILLQYDSDIIGSIVRENLVGLGVSFGIRIAEPNAIVEDNDCRDSGSLFDLSYTDTSDGATNMNNQYITFNDDR